MDMSLTRSGGFDATGRILGGTAYMRPLFGLASIAAEIAAILGAALVSSLAWRLMPFAQPSSLETQMRLALAAALLVTFFTLLRGEYRISVYLSGASPLGRTMRVWNITFFLIFLTAFALRRTDELSRGSVVLFYFYGCAVLWGARSLTWRGLRLATKLRLVLAQRVLIVGTEPALRELGRRYQPWDHGLEIVGSVVLRGEQAKAGRDCPLELKADLLRAVEMARVGGVADVYVAVPWSDTPTIDCCVDAFLNTPVAIHLAPERILDRFDRISIARVGNMASLELTRPMSSLAVTVKRAFDLAVAAAVLVLSLPLLAAIAAAIKLDSEGPVFFRQTRYGFNQRPFRILKFRTMRTYADEGPVPQARRDDPRITRIGRWLRRLNFDELPQLVNVLQGHMSLVGPRPHAVPHNRDFERRIALYARRHNVRPGITGWAQVHGLRGETDTDDKMRRRVEYDLYYIDSWSLGLDLRIILRTLFSAAVHRNAR